MLPRVAVTTLGCKTNQFESAAMIDRLSGEGFPVVPFEESADVYVINTCTVTARTDAESRRLIRRAMRQNPDARVVVTGCYAQVSPGELEKIPGVKLVIGNSEKRDIVSLVRELGDEARVMVSDIGRETVAGPLRLDSFADHTRAFLQVQNGCDSFCSYCIVPHARGRSRSVSPDEALAAIGAFTSKGFREIVLTGIHLSGYGRDLQPAVGLEDLVEAVEERRLAHRLRLGSLEPTEISDRLIRLMGGSDIICPHLHVPLQSGDDGVLNRMNRSYDGSFLRDLMVRVNETVRDVCIGVDLIAGFPGETDREFRTTYELVQTLPLAYLHVFPFSPRPGTPAAAMDGQLPSRVITDRAKLLRDLSEAKKAQYAARFAGRELRVLVQSEAGSLLRGLSRNYLTVSFSGSSSLHNQEVLVKVSGTSLHTLVGECVTDDDSPSLGLGSSKE